MSALRRLQGPQSSASLLTVAQLRAGTPHAAAWDPSRPDTGCRARGICADRPLEHMPGVAEVAFGEREDLGRSHGENQDAIALETAIGRLVLPAAVPFARPGLG